MVYPDAQARELDGKRPSQEVLDKMAYGCRCLTAVAVYSYANIFCSEVNLHAMRLGPGKHLKGLSLFNGLVKPEEVSLVVFFLEMVFMIFFCCQFDYFHEVGGQSLGNRKLHFSGRVNSSLSPKK